MSKSGGTCVRHATPKPEVRAQDCGSLDDAYQEAACGDTINIDAGTYPDQPLDDNPALDNCARNVVFQATPGLNRSQVVIGEDSGNSIDSGDSASGGASNWTLQDVTVTANINLLPCPFSSEPSACDSDAHNVTINRIHGGSFFAWIPHLTVENSDLGPCYNLVSLPAGVKNADGDPGPSYSPDPSIRCNQNIKGFGADTVFSHNVVHDFLDDDSNTYFDHFECMFIGASDHLMIDANKFYDCQIYAIFIQNAGSGPMTIQNNWFWASQGGMGACSSNGHCPTESAGGDNAWSITDGDNPGAPLTTNVLVRFNSFGPTAGFSDQAAPTDPPDASWRFLGNIIGRGGCQGSITYGYNLWQPGGGGPCGTGDVQMTSGSPFVSTGQDGAEPANLNLTCDANPARDLVKPDTTDYQLNYDIDGNPRNPSGPRDAGASASTSCGT